MPASFQLKSANAKKENRDQKGEFAKEKWNPPTKKERARLVRLLDKRKSEGFVPYTGKDMKGIKHVIDTKTLPPPGWLHPHVHLDSSNKNQYFAWGIDSKGRQQSRQNPEYAAKKLKEKFVRVRDLRSRFAPLEIKNEVARKSEDPATADSADALNLVIHSAVRAGGEADTGAKETAYGATTLLGKHVMKKPNGDVYVHFTGKDNVLQHHLVDEPSTVAMLLNRAKKSGPNEKLFPNTNQAKLLAHTRSVSGGENFKTHDFRSLFATRAAEKKIASMPVPKNLTEYKSSIKMVGEHVASRLGNKPAESLKSYIDPSVFRKWKGAMEK